MMKLKTNWQAIEQGKKLGKLPPLRTTKEIAEEFGISVRQLCGFLAKDATSPKPKLVKTNRTTRKQNSWYNQQEMREWWKKRNNQSTNEAKNEHK